MGETAVLRVLVVDSQPVMRDGLRINIEAEPDLRVVAEAGDCRTALVEAARHRPDVVLLDLSLVTSQGGSFIRLSAKTRLPMWRAAHPVHSRRSSTDPIES